MLLVLDQVQHWLPARTFQWSLLAPLLKAPPRRLMVSFCAFVVCLNATFLTGSRAGVILSLLVLMLAFAIFFRSMLTSRRALAFMIAGGAGVSLLLLQLMGGAVSRRFDIQGLSDEGRLSTYQATLRLIME